MDFLPKGDVFSRDQIDAYIELKWEEVMRWETTPSPGRVRHVLFELTADADLSTGTSIARDS